MKENVNLLKRSVNKRNVLWIWRLHQSIHMLIEDNHHLHQVMLFSLRVSKLLKEDNILLKTNKWMNNKVVMMMKDIWAKLDRSEVSSFSLNRCQIDHHQLDNCIQISHYRVMSLNNLKWVWVSSLNKTHFSLENCLRKIKN